jgi:hypothetical protein
VSVGCVMVLTPTLRLHTWLPQRGLASFVANETWMSGIQNRAKPFLVPLFEGHFTTLHEHSQRLIAAWIAMATIAAEFDKRLERAIPDKDREWFAEEHVPPNDTWKIWIGAYFGTPLGFFWHSTLPISSPEHIPEGGDPNFPWAHTQTTTFIVGQLYVHVFSCPIADVVRKVSLGVRGNVVMSQIWPPTDRVFGWPKALLTDRDAQSIPVSIFNGFRSIPPPAKLT